MSESGGLHKTYFLCKKCNLTKVVENLGEVVAGPLCDSCKSPMRRVELRQTELDLFPLARGRRKRER